MRDLRIIVIESELAERGFEWTDRLTHPTPQKPATRKAKALSKRASLLAAHLGGATDPETVAACRAWIEACDRLGWSPEVDAVKARELLGEVD